MGPAGTVYELRSGDDVAVVAGLGAGLRSCRLGGVDVVQPVETPGTPPMGAGGVLIPWPNRVAGACWRWRGRTWRLAVTEPSRGHAIHGLLREIDWTAREQHRDAVTLTADVPAGPGWPEPLDVATTYRVGDGGLTVTHEITATGSGPVPVGVGTHPYLRVGDAAVADCVLLLAADRVVDTDEGLIPTGVRPVSPAEDMRAGRRVGDLDLDTCFAAAPDRGEVLARLVAPDGEAVELWAGAAAGWVQVFTPDDLAGRGPAVAVEPMTCPPDALNSGTDLRVLAPGERFALAWGLRRRRARPRADGDHPRA